MEERLEGHNQAWRVHPLPSDAPGTRVRVKVREPRPDVVPFDLRTFRNEEDLLHALRGHVAGVPSVLDYDGVEAQLYIEGVTLGHRYPPGGAIPEALSDQITDVFRALVAVSPEGLCVERRCHPADRPADGDCAGFLERLIAFTEEVYWGSRPLCEDLFEELGLGEESFRHLRKHVAGLHERPFCLLHGDLHRENLIIDAAGRLWTIDWELAALGDPLYDLATHLYLMRYPTWQEHRTAREWSRAVEQVRPGGTAGWEYDLPRILDYKRAQSVFTDIIRLCLRWDGRRSIPETHVLSAALEVRRLLARAEVPLGLDSVPGAGRIASALRRRHRQTVGSPV